MKGRASTLLVHGSGSRVVSVSLSEYRHLCVEPSQMRKDFQLAFDHVQLYSFDQPPKPVSTCGVRTRAPPFKCAPTDFGGNGGYR